MPPLGTGIEGPACSGLPPRANLYRPSGPDHSDAPQLPSVIRVPPSPCPPVSASFRSQSVPEKPTRVRPFAPRYFFRGAAADDFPSAVASFWTEVDDVIRGLYYVEVMFDYQYCVTCIDQ